MEADNNVFAKMLKDSNNMEEVEYQHNNIFIIPENKT